MSRVGMTDWSEFQGPLLTIPGILSINMNPMGNYYYFVLVISLIAIYILYRIVNSPFGLTLKGIRDSENRVAFAGISIRNYRLLSFTIAGLYAGLAGSMIPPLENTVTPPLAHWTQSAEPVMVTLLGGIHTFSGPIVGSILFYLIKDIIVRYTQYWLIWFGSIVVFLVLVFRGGIVIFFTERIWPLLSHRSPPLDEEAGGGIEDTFMIPLNPPRKETRLRYCEWQNSSGQRNLENILVWSVPQMMLTSRSKKECSPPLSGPMERAKQPLSIS